MNSEKPDSAADRDQRIAVILSDVADAICQGELVDLEIICGENPDLADEIRQLWGALLVTDTAGAIYDEGLSDEPGISRWKSLSLPTTIGDYNLIEELGRGGMGVVFRARHKSVSTARSPSK